MLTHLCNPYPRTPRFYILKPGFYRLIIYTFFLFLLLITDCGGGGGGGQGGCERRIEVFEKIKKVGGIRWGGGGGGLVAEGVRLVGVQGGCECNVGGRG